MRLQPLQPLQPLQKKGQLQPPFGQSVVSPKRNPGCTTTFAFPIGFPGIETSATAEGAVLLVDDLPIKNGDFP